MIKKSKWLWFYKPNFGSLWHLIGTVERRGPHWGPAISVLPWWGEFFISTDHPQEWRYCWAHLWGNTAASVKDRGCGTVVAILKRMTQQLQSSPARSNHFCESAYCFFPGPSFARAEKVTRCIVCRHWPTRWHCEPDPSGTLQSRRLCGVWGSSIEDTQS